MRTSGWIGLLCLSLFASVGRAGDRPANPKALGVAMLEFRSSSEQAKEFAGWLPDLLVTALEEATELRLVTHSEVQRIQEEQKIDIVKLLTQKKGLQIVKVLDAQVVVRGKVTMTEEAVAVVATVIGPVTGVEVPIEVKHPATAREQLVKELAASLRQVLRERRSELLPPPAEVLEVRRTRDIIASLGQVLPTVAGMVLDARAPKDRPSDVTANSSLVAVLPKLGYDVAAVGDKVHSDWLSLVAAGKGAFPGPSAFPATVVVAGTAYTEYLKRDEAQVSYRGHIDIRAYDVKTGAVVANYAGTSVVAGDTDDEARRLSLEDIGRRGAMNVAIGIATAQKNR